MAHRIIWLPAAAQDLEEIFGFISQTSRAYADSLIERILSAVEGVTNSAQGPRRSRRAHQGR